MTTLKVDHLCRGRLGQSALTCRSSKCQKRLVKEVELIASGRKRGSRRKYCDDCGQGRIWYMEIMVAICARFSSQKIVMQSFPKYPLLRTCRFSDKERTIASKDVEKVARDAGTYKRNRWPVPCFPIYNPPLHEADRSRVWSGIGHWIQMQMWTTMTGADLIRRRIEEIDATRCDVNLQRNRLEGTNFKPQDQMS